MKKTYINKEAMPRRERKAYKKQLKGMRKMNIFLFGVYVKTVKGKLGISINTRDGNFEVSARAIYNGLLANPGGFYSPAFSEMDALDAAITLFKDEKQNVKDGVAGAEAAKVAAKKAVMTLLRMALNYINNLSGKDQENANEIITGCKMQTLHTGRKEKQELSAKTGTAAGEVLLSALALKLDGKYIITTYYWQFSIDDGKTWENIQETNEANTVATGMLGVPTLFRKRTYSKKTGLSVWCNPVSVYPK